MSTSPSMANVLDPSTAISRLETPIIEMETATWSTLVAGDDGELEAPSRIALKDDILYVTDNAPSRISAFSRDGERLDYLDLDLSSANAFSKSRHRTSDALAARGPHPRRTIKRARRNGELTLVQKRDTEPGGDAGAIRSFAT